MDDMTPSGITPSGITPSGIDGWVESRADTRWLSYDDIVELTGIKRESVTRMVRRKKWAKRPGNEPGSVRIAVPAEIIEAMEARRNARPPRAAADATAAPPATDLVGAIRELEVALGEVQAERDLLRLELAQERLAASGVREAVERLQADMAEQQMRAADQRARLNSQFQALASELARLQALQTGQVAAAPQPAPPPPPPAQSPPLLRRVAALTRWMRPSASRTDHQSRVVTTPETAGQITWG